MTDEEVLELFVTHPSYFAFYDKHPDAIQELNINRYGANLEVGIANYQNGDFLILDMHLDRHDLDVSVNIRCESENDDYQNNHVDGLFAVDFIYNTDCLMR